MTLFARTLVSLALAGLPVAAAANPGIEMGGALACNGRNHVERVLLLESENHDVVEAIKQVNAEANDPTACAFLTIAFMREEEAGKVTLKKGEVSIVKIVVVGVYKDQSWIRIAPTIQFTAAMNKGLSI